MLIITLDFHNYWQSHHCVQQLAGWTSCVGKSRVRVDDCMSWWWSDNKVHSNKGILMKLPVTSFKSPFLPDRIVAVNFNNIQTHCQIFTVSHCLAFVLFFYYSVFTSVIITFCIFLCFVKQIKAVCKVYSFSTLQQKNKQRHLHNSICGNLFLVFLLLANSNPAPEQSVRASYAMLGHHKSFRTHLLPW